MQYTLKAPKTLDAKIDLPASKSISNRALIIHAISKGVVLPDNLSDCDDTNVMVNALLHTPGTIDVQAAGTAMRFLTAYLSNIAGEHIITGTQRMKERPIGVLVDALKYLGADIEYIEKVGFPPLKIKGKTLTGGALEIDGNISSQYISALLMIAPCLQNGLELKMHGEIASRPYIDLTLWMMKEFGAEADWRSVDTIIVKPTPYTGKEYLIENDWSSASYWYEMVALSEDLDSRIELTGLTESSKQGDAVVRHIFSLLGVKTTFVKNECSGEVSVVLKRQATRVPRLEYDFNNSPDLAQTVVVTCCMLGIPFHFTGLHTLKIKETDRITALINELRKLGFVVETKNESELIWYGERCESTNDAIDTYNDHRMALAFAPVAMMTHRITINNPRVVSKSYPHYWNDLNMAGFDIQEEEE